MTAPKPVSPVERADSAREVIARSDQTTIGDVSMSVEAGMVAAMEQAEEIIRPIVDRATLSDSIRLYDLQVRIAKPLAEAADTIARLRERVAELEAREKSEPNPEWEEKANAAHAAILAEEGVEPEQTLKMLETWKSDAEPANESGQVTFSRAMLDSATDALRTVLAELSSLNAAGTFADGIEAAAAAVQQAITELGPGLSQYDRGQFDGLRTARSRIRALSPAPEAKPVAAIEALRSHQIQLDQDGIQVGVSRQALEEVLSFIEGKC